MQEIKILLLELIRAIPCNYYAQNGTPVPMTREEILVKLFEIYNKL